MTTPDLFLLLEPYLELSYPLLIEAEGDWYRGEYPDLPGCELYDTDARRLYCRLVLAKRAWLKRRIAAGDPVPQPSDVPGSAQNAA